MATEAPPPADAAAHDALPPAPAADAAQKPPVRRSWRRKFRKMRIRFDDAMQQSNTLIMEEWKAMGVARRLQAENDQLLDALLDFNDQPRVPARQRFDIARPDAAEATPPATLQDQLPSAALTADQHTQHTDPLHNAHALQQLLKSLSALEASVPHTAVCDLTTLPDGIDLSEHAPGYMSPHHEEEYLLALDALLEDPAFVASTARHRTLHLGPSQPPLSEKDLTIRNPDSVYNWLRKNQPQVFLQDKDAPHHDNASEKTASKAGSKKSRPSNMGAGGTPAPKDDHDGDDSAAPETKPKGKKGAADPDDTAYRPKGGSSRPAKRKRDAAEGDAKGSRKKNRPSTAAAPPATTPAAG